MKFCISNIYCKISRSFRISYCLIWHFNYRISIRSLLLCYLISSFIKTIYNESSILSFHLCIFCYIWIRFLFICC